MTKNTHNNECNLHAQPSGENIMILHRENWAKLCLLLNKHSFCLRLLKIYQHYNNL